MKRALRPLCLLPLALPLAGCVVLSEYKPAAGEPTAVIDVAMLPDPAFCLDGVGYKAPSAGENKVRVPAERHISLYSNFYASDGYMTYTCTAGAGFTFGAGSELIAALEQDSRGCWVDLVRLDALTPTGVAVEPSLGRPVCNPWNPDGE